MVAGAGMHVITWKGAPDWLAAYDAAAAALPGLTFGQTPEWFGAYVRHIVRPPGRSVLVELREAVGGPLLLAMPLLVEPGGMRRLVSPSNYYTAHFEPLRLPGGEDGRLYAGLLRGLDRAGLPWDELRLEPLAPEGRAYDALHEALAAAGYAWRADKCHTNWYLEVGQGGYEVYERRLPSRLRNTIRRQRARLERERACEIRIADTPEGVAASLGDYERVYERSWKPAEGNVLFIRDILERFAARGWARLAVLYVDGEAAAAQIWFVKDATASIFKLSYVPDYARYSPGTLLTAAMMRRVIDEEGVEVVDFLTGDDAYKKDWMSHRRDRYSLRIFNRTARGRLAGLWNTRVKDLLQGRWQGACNQ
ncbi:MAG TPA: GNAT family N-acetyltransferase [Gammaproteobacteria bacterium]|nr:GNAT family N-acetyltransferase [Gammaproteobacteria bacterium]